ncbi:MAG: hypothetical protein DWQ42_17660 [Planctomycetota bacterium]|nr:MAG: hypothetical protein DWQ42_17660 [Planctomycetota bacterium]REK44295.1 MAG: hypothetical protein DWQ46_10395 [Planctomycetota bacterium]
MYPVESVRPQVTSNVATGDLRLSYGSAAGNYAGLDNFDRVIEQLWLDNASDEVDRFEYGYDEVGNRLWRENVKAGNLGTPVHLDELYEYDEVYRLIATDRGNLNGSHDALTSTNFTQDWTLDGLGNWEAFDDDGTSVTRTVNEANEIATSSAGINPEYDAAGNMTAGPTPGNQGVRQHYEYDAWNRLTGAYDDDGSGDLDPNSPIATFEYDGRNYRIRKTAGGVVEASFYNENQQLLETQVSGSMTEEFVWDLRYIDAPIFRYDGTDTFYYTSDANMNVTGLVDASTGLVVERYHYDSYGRVEFLSDVFASLGTQATQYGNDFLYTGRKLDTETGLMYYRARYYDPSLGRFVQRDPIGYAAGDSNLYRYVGNSPINAVDPSGLDFIFGPAPGSGSEQTRGDRPHDGEPTSGRGLGDLLDRFGTTGSGRNPYSSDIPGEDPFGTSLTGLDPYEPLEPRFGEDETKVPLPSAWERYLAGKNGLKRVHHARPEDDALRSQWIALIDLARTELEKFKYAHVIGALPYLEALADTIATAAVNIEVGGATKTASAAFYWEENTIRTDGVTTLAELGHSNMGTPWQTVDWRSLDTVIHESVHAFNWDNNIYSDDHQYNELLAHGIAHFISTEDFRRFERGVENEFEWYDSPSEIQEQWDSLWGKTKFSVPGTAIHYQWYPRVRYAWTKPINGTIKPHEYFLITEYSGIQISCEKLAELYTKEYADKISDECPLKCPSDLGWFQ